MQETIKQKDEEIKQLQQKVQEQAEQIIKLTAEIENNIEIFKQQAMKIQQLEGAIAGLEGSSGALGSDNKELLHEINKLKDQLEAEKDAHIETRERLEEEIVELNNDNLEFRNRIGELEKNLSYW